MYEEGDPSSGTLSPYVSGSQIDRAEAYTWSDEKQVEEAGLSNYEAMILRGGEIICRMVLEMGVRIWDGSLDVMRLASSDLNEFRDAMQQVRNC